MLVNQLAYVVIVNLAARADVDAASDVLDYGVGYAAYANAYLIFILPHSIITVSVVTGLLPAAEPGGRRRRPGARSGASLSEAWRLTGVGVVAAAAALVALGPDLTGILYSGTVGPDGAQLHRPGRRGLRPRACRPSPRSTSRCAASTPSRTPGRRSCCRS